MKSREKKGSPEIKQEYADYGRLDFEMMKAELDTELENIRDALEGEMNEKLEQSRDTLTEMAERQEEILKERFTTFVEGVRDLLPPDLEELSPGSLLGTAEEKSPEIAEVLEELDDVQINESVDRLKQAKERTGRLVGRAVKNTTRFKNQVAAAEKLGDGYDELSEKHEEIIEEREKVSDDRLLAKLEESDEESRQIIPVVEKLREKDVYVTQVIEVEQKSRQEDDDAPRERKRLEARYGKNAESYLKAVQTILDSVSISPEELTDEVTVAEIVDSMDIPKSEKKAIMESEEIFAELDEAAASEVLDGSPEWGQQILESELGFSPTEKFDVVEGDLGGVYYQLSNEDLAVVVEKGGVREVSPGIYVAEETVNEDASGLIYLMGQEESLSEKIREAELMKVASILYQTGIESAYRELISEEVQEQVKDEFEGNYEEVIDTFFQTILGEGITPNSEPDQIRKNLQKVVRNGIDTRMQKTKLELRNIAEKHLPMSSTRGELTAVFSDSRQRLRAMDGETAALVRNLRESGYDDEYIRFVTQETNDSVREQLGLVDRLDLLINSALDDFPSPDFKNNLFKRFQEVPPEDWEAEIEAARREQRERI